MYPSVLGSCCGTPGDDIGSFSKGYIKAIWGLPIIRGTFLGVPIIRTSILGSILGSPI